MRRALQRKHEQLAVTLAREIVSSRLPAGEPFPTGEALAAEHSVSRTVTREAMQALASSGLLRIGHGKRTVVNDVAEWRFLDVLVQSAMEGEELPEKLVRDLFEARRCIEMETARLCALRASGAVVETLTAINSSWKALLPPEGRLATPELIRNEVPLDRAFHGAIGDGSGNVVLARVARDAQYGVDTTWRISRIDAERLRTIHAQHSEIAAAIARRTPDDATDHMRRHVEWGLRDPL